MSTITDVIANNPRAAETSSAQLLANGSFTPMYSNGLMAGRGVVS